MKIKTWNYLYAGLFVTFSLAGCHSGPLTDSNAAKSDESDTGQDSSTDPVASDTESVKGNSTDTPVNVATDTPMAETTGTSGDEETDTPTVIDTDTPKDVETDTRTEVATDTPGKQDTDTPSDTGIDTETGEVREFRTKSLKPAADCALVWEMTKARFANQMVERLERGRTSALEEAQWAGIDCEMWYWGLDTDYDYDYDPDAEVVPAGNGDTGEGASAYSTTNNQVAGVDEADFMKNDGSYIYILADGAFQIVDAWPANSARLISRTPIEGDPKKLFIYENKAIVYSSLEAINGDTNFSYANGNQGSECTYGYDCDFVGDGRKLKITTLDISNLESPQVIRETKMNGSYLSARRIGDAVYTVVVFPELVSYIPSLSYYPQGINTEACWSDDVSTPEEINAAYDALLEENLRIINNFDLQGALPTVTDQRIANGQVADESVMGGDCNNFYVSDTGDGNNLISVLGLDLDEFSDFTMSSVVSRPGAVYADGDSLYLAMRHYRQFNDYWFVHDVPNDDEATTIHRFNLDNETATANYQGSGVVKGRILNQFAMDEYEGHLRIATTTGRLPGADVHSTMSVLSVETGADMELIGQIDNIAPTEDIRSARFNGDRGYIVTFKKTDPLFVFDLSDPDNPQITGELKIPGYSTYMHMMDDSHILSIGFDAEDQGSFAFFQGIQLQILDITDIANPILIHKEVIGTRGSTSDAATDHLAFNYFRSFDQLAIPMVVCEESLGGGDYGDYMTFSGLMVYRVTVANGFSYLGGIPHAPPEVDGDQTGMCNNWWTSGHSQVKRSIFMDDYVYSVAPDLINVSNRADLEHPVSAVPLVIQQ